VYFVFLELKGDSKKARKLSFQNNRSKYSLVQHNKGYAPKYLDVRNMQREATQ